MDPFAGPRVRTPSRTGGGRKVALTGTKTVLGLVAALVLALTGYYWVQLAGFTEDLTTVDVIAGGDPGAEPLDGAMDILLVGMDSRTDAKGNPLSDEQLATLNAGEADGVLNTDTIILVHIPVEGGKAVGISIPRDSYVDIPDYGTHKINSAYSRAKNTTLSALRGDGLTNQAELEVRSNEQGAKNLIATVQRLTGVTVDHYAEVNLLGFFDITKAVGGIDVCLNEPVRDRFSGADFPAGRQTLSGAPALAFVRQRKGLPNGDLDRVARQQVFLSGMAKKVVSQDTLAPGSDTLDKLQDAVSKSVVLDKGWNVVEFAQQMTELTGGNLSFQTIPYGTVALDTPEDGSAVEIDPDEVKRFVQGVIPDAAPTGADSPADDPASPAEITVDVRNAAGVTGLAAGVADTLSEKGFRIGDVDNADARATTVVNHAAGEQANGTAVAAALGGNTQVEEAANIPAGQVTVLLGADYRPGDNPLTGSPLLDLAPHPARQPPVADGTCVN
ncbi:LCP family protein [Actinophytocola sp.]|uniref:LCP family protein n=1 Tax=Actinophytocola sp. TaxID=1872138 RepID=UPI0025C6F5AD|nr:LCP family protein [Actinophytocola sp.]